MHHHFVVVASEAQIVSGHTRRFTAKSVQLTLMRKHIEHLAVLHSYVNSGETRFMMSCPVYS